jgi:hypothetical protein
MLTSFDDPEDWALPIVERWFGNKEEAYGLPEEEDLTVTEAFTSTQQYRSSASNIICITGNQKSGKSCAVAVSSWADDCVVNVHDIDGRWEFAQQLWARPKADGGGGHEPKRLILRPVDSYHSLHEGLWNLPKADVHVLDTYTSAMNWFKGYVEQPKPSVDAQGLSVLPITDWMKVGGKISGLALNYFHRWLSQVCAQKSWGIIICQEKSDGDPSKLIPDLVGKARAEVAGKANFLFHLEYERINVAGKIDFKKCFRTRETATVMACDGAGCLDTLEPLDIAAIIRKIEKHRGQKTAPEEKK